MRIVGRMNSYDAERSITVRLDGCLRLHVATLMARGHDGACVSSMGVT